MLVPSLFRELETDDEGQVVAEAAVVAITDEGAEGLDTSVFFVVFQQKGGIVDEHLRDMVAQSVADQHVVDALPPSLIAVGTLGTMRTAGITRGIVKAVLLHILKRGAVGIVVEIASDNDLILWR